MEQSLWQKRLRKRSDMVTRVTHLTRGETDDEAFDVLRKILVEKKLIANNKNGFNVGGAEVCCFQEIPLLSIAENLRYEKDNGWEGMRYSPFGLRFLKVDLYRNGGRPVIYGDSEELKKILDESDYWRIVKMDLSNRDRVVDWSHEREWRINRDYSFEYSDTEIIVSSPLYYHKLIDWCIKSEHMDILQQVNGIVVLSSIYN